MMDSVKGLSDEMLGMLDVSLVGRNFRLSEEGTYIGKDYVATVGYEWPQVYDGKTLPKSEHEVIGGGFITMKVAKTGPDPFEAEENSVLIGLPIDRAKADEIAQMLGEKRIEDCVYFDFRSPISWVNDELYGDTAIFDALNSTAKGYEALNPEDKIKFKAVCENEGCDDLDKAARIMDNLGKYQLSYHIPDYETYAREYMSLKLPTDFDTSVLQNCNLSALGINISKRLECALTDYGVVSKEGGSIFETVREEIDEEEILSEDQEEGIGGMQM